MSTQDTLNADAQPDGAHVTPADAAASGDSSGTLSLADLNSRLGKNFPDVATALKSLEDTQSYVGKKIEAAAPADTASVTKVEFQALQNQLFYATNPEYKGYEDIIASMGSNPAEVVGTDVFKKVLEKGKVADEVAQTKSVVSSSSRLQQSTTVIDEAIKVANARGTTVEDVATALARGINSDLAA